MVKLDAKRDKLPANNRLVLDALLGTKGAIDDVTAFLQVLADILDLAVVGGDAYVTIGANRERTSLLTTIRVDNRTAYAGGVDIVEMMAKVGELL